MVDNRYATALVIGSVLSLLATVYLSVAVGTQHWYQYSSPALKREAINVSKLRDEFVDGDFDEKTYSDTMFSLNGTLGLWWRCIQVPLPSQSHWFKEPGMTSCWWYHICAAFTNFTNFKTDMPDCIIGKCDWSDCILYLLKCESKFLLIHWNTADVKHNMLIWKQCECQCYFERIIYNLASHPVDWWCWWLMSSQLTLCPLFLTIDPKLGTQCVSFTLPQQFSPKYRNSGNNSEEDLLRTCESTLVPPMCHEGVFKFHFTPPP